MQAQSQAIAMMQKAGLKLTDKIQCRRQGCADILSDVEALKYHLHIHNITDVPATCIDPSSSSCRPSLPKCSSTSNSKTLKRTHSRSRSSVEARAKSSKTTVPLRKRSAGSLFALRPSPRESIQEAPSLSSIAKAFVPDHSPSKSAGPPPEYNKKRPTKHSRTHSRGRKLTKDSAGSVGADHPSIAMLLSPPSSPVLRGRLVPPPPTNMLISFALNPRTEGEGENGIPFPSENAVPEKLIRSRSPLRALSPTRALSPIRDGIRRVLSFGYSVEPTNE
ncbi:hypothetical protein JVU11DRAFT_4296 [Chiua virens]|nr:hypothetical protein JVU11DRAFT_4296 [Chiua virens]